jgi:glyoxylate reductase
MERKKVVITYPLPGDPLTLLEGDDSLDVWMHRETSRLSREALVRHVSHADGILVTPADGPIEKEIYDAAGKQLKVISCFSVGFDYVDIKEAARRDIVVGITPDATTEPTADIAWLLILGTCRNLPRAVQRIRSGHWTGIAPNDRYGTRLVNKTLLIVGAGRIGTAVARRAIGWNMNILYTARTSKPHIENAPYHATRVSLEQGLQNADIVSLHIPFNHETHHLIDANALSSMKPDAVLINTSRGGVINERALVDALSRGVIRGAGLDVYENEPHLSPGLLDAANCLLLPHIGTATTEDRKWMTEMAIANLAAGVSCRPLPHPVTSP